MVSRAITPDNPEQVTLAVAYEHFLATGDVPEQDRVDLIRRIRTGEIPYRIGAATEYRKGELPQPLSLTQIPSSAVPIPGAKLFDLPRSSAKWRDSETGSIIVAKEITVSRDAVLRARPTLPAQPSATPHLGGRPKEYSREQILYEAMAFLWVNGLPLTQSRLREEVALILGDASPGETLLKKLLDPLYKRLKAEEAEPDRE
jgi:hypothetical protein